jgi:PAS domain S-box-containing protein
MGIYDYLPADIAEYRINQGYEVVRSGKPVRFQDEREGRYYDTNIYPVFDDEGKVSSLAIFSGDITERKRAEETLQESEERFRSLSESSPMGVFHTDKEGRVLYTNKRWQEITSLALEESLGFGWSNALHPDDKKILLEEWDRCLSEEKGYSGEFRFVSKSREVKWVYTKTAPIRSETGQVIGHVGSNEDITERKQTEEALQGSEERFRAIYENALVGLYQTTPDGRILMANPALVQMLGYSSFEELAQLNLEEEGYSRDYQRSVFKQRVEAEDRVVGLESRWMRCDGTTLFVRESARIVRDKDGEILYYEGTVADLTERKKAEQALRESEERLKILFESAPDTIYLIDSEGRFVDGNRAAMKLIGFTKDEVIGKSLAELGLLSAGQLSKAEENLKKAAAGKLSGPNEYTLKRKDGTHVSVEVRTFPVKIEGEVLTLGIARDVTEQKRTEKELLEHQAKLKSLASQ